MLLSHDCPATPVKIALELRDQAGRRALSDCTNSQERIPLLLHLSLSIEEQSPTWLLPASRPQISALKMTLSCLSDWIWCPWCLVALRALMTKIRFDHLCAQYRHQGVIDAQTQLEGQCQDGSFLLWSSLWRWPQVTPLTDWRHKIWKKNNEYILIIKYE